MNHYELEHVVRARSEERERAANQDRLVTVARRARPTHETDVPATAPRTGDLAVDRARVAPQPPVVAREGHLARLARALHQRSPGSRAAV